MLSSVHRLLIVASVLVLAMHGSAFAQQPVGELYATDASVKGSIVLAGSGTGVLSGSSIQAGAKSATLKLERGGSLLVCEGTKLSVTASQTGRELLFSLNSGNLEMNYPLGAAADTLLTPDLRLLLPGPGTVHLAVRVTPQGDTCVQSLPWNASAIVVSETMGDATYQVKPDETVMFKAGHLSEASHIKQSCGCAKSQPLEVAKAAPSAPPPVAQPSPAAPMATAPIPPAEQHIAVEVPFVFRATDPMPDLSVNVATLKLEKNKVVQFDPTVLPPASAKTKPPANNETQSATGGQAHGFLSRVGAFFASIFH